MSPHGARLRRVVVVAGVEARRLLRDHVAISLALVLPALQLLLFGYAVTPIAHDIPVAIAGDVGPRKAADRLIAGAGSFRLVASGLPPGGAVRKVRAGEALIAVELPPLPDLDHPEVKPRTSVRIVADATDPMAVRVALAGLEAAFWRAQTQLEAGPTVEVQWLYNPDGHPGWGTTPALAGVVTMISMLMLSALTLVRDREQGVLEGLLASPLGVAELMAGKAAPLFGIGVFQTALVLGSGRLLFNLPLEGDLVALTAFVLLYLAANLALGIAISSAARTSIQALQWAVFFYLPSMLLSGFLYPVQAMPAWARVLSEALPLTHFVRVARGVLLRGDGGGAVLKEALPVAAFALLATLGAILQPSRIVSSQE